jgi:hypothetical protein
MEAVRPPSGVVVYLAERKPAPKDPEQQREPPPPPPPVADISIRLSANGDVTYERHNLNVYTAQPLMMGCYVMLGETIGLMSDT